MRRPSASSHQSMAYDPLFYVPGGFCIPVQLAASDYDVVPDLPAHSDALALRKSPSGLAVVLRAGAVWAGLRKTWVITPFPGLSPPGQPDVTEHD